MIKKIQNFIISYKKNRLDKTLGRIEKISKGRLKLTRCPMPILDAESNSLAYGVMITINGKTESPIVYIPIDYII